MDESTRHQRWQTIFQAALTEEEADIETSELFEHSQPTFYIDKYEKVAGTMSLELGLSRLEWLPDLPSGSEWPEQDGQALDFLAQLNLADLEKGFHPLLPERGWLYFFAGSIWDQAIIPHRVLYFDGPVAELVRTAPPARLKPPEMLNPDTALISFTPSFTMDPKFMDLFDGLFNRDPIYEEKYGDLDELLSEIFQREETRIGGYPYGFQGGGFDRDALLYLNGFETLIQHGYFHLPPPFKTQAEKDAYRSNRFRELGEAGVLEQMELEAGRYQAIQSDLAGQTVPIEMLFGLGSVMGRNWVDAGFLEFFIRKDDLAARRFERTYCDVIST